METSINPSAISAVLILMAVVSLFAMFSLTQINSIVHGDLYNYNLQFSYRWAMPYWVFSGIIFGLSWVNISLSIIATLYIFKKSRKHVLGSENIPQTGKIKEATQLKEEKEQRKLSEFVETQKQESTTPKEEITETPSEEFIVEETKQSEKTVEMVEVYEDEVDQQRIEEEIEQSEEIEAATVPPEDDEQRQPFL